MTKLAKHSHSLLVLLSIVFLLVLMMISLFVMAIVHQSVDQFESYVISSRYADTVSAGNLFNHDLEALYMLMYNELSDTTLTKLRLYFSSSTFNYRYLELTNIVETRLFSIETALDFAETVEVLLPDSQRMITSNSVTRYTEDQTEQLEIIQKAQDQKVMISNGKLLFLTGKYTGLGEYRYNVIILCRISQSGMTHYLSKFINSDNSDSIALYLQTENELQSFTVAGASLSEKEHQQIASLIADSDNGSAQMISENTRYLLTWVTSAMAPLKICHMTPMALIDAQLREYRSMTIVVCIMIIILMIALIFFLYCTLLKPLTHIRRALKRVEDGDLSTRLGTTWTSEYQQIFGQFNDMTEHLQLLIEREYELNLLNTKAEMKQMRYQINPHFLYNTYFNLRAMLIDEEYDQAIRLSDLMGRYLRYITVSSHDFAALGEELEHAVAYMQIQQIRFGSRIETQVDPLPDWAHDMEVPRLIVQPLIENAFEHGVKHQEGKCVIAIHFSRQDGAFRITVEDNGHSADDALITHVKELLENGDSGEGAEGVALINIHKRLTILYGQGSGLFVSRSSLGGFCSEIRIMEGKTDVSHADC